jgi:hypothetical protein
MIDKYNISSTIEEEIEKLKSVSLAPDIEKELDEIRTREPERSEELKWKELRIKLRKKYKPIIESIGRPVESRTPEEQIFMNKFHEFYNFFNKKEQEADEKYYGVPNEGLVL